MLGNSLLAASRWTVRQSVPLYHQHQLAVSRPLAAALSRSFLTTSTLRADKKVKPSLAEKPAGSPVGATKSSANGSGEFEPVVNDLKSGTGPRVVNSSSPVNPTLETESPSSSTTATTEQQGASSLKTEQATTPLEPTPAYEIPDKPDLSKLPSLDIGFDEPADAATRDSKGQIESPDAKSNASGGSGGSGRTGARSKPSLSSHEQKRRNLTRFMLVTALIGGTAGAFYLASKEDDTAAAAAQDQASNVSAWERFKNNLSGVLDTFNKPVFDKLLPDPLPANYQRPYTLLVDLEGLLVCNVWDRQGGWRVAKRPGVDYFLAYLSQFYEIVLFTTQPLFTADPIANKLDPFQAYMPYKLFRDNTRNYKGKIVKDLSYLNRDLSKVILLDTNPEHATLQPENFIPIPRWEGKPGDRGLIDMIPFLESIGIFAPPDVRPVIKAYEGKDIPKEYALKEAEGKRRAIAEWEKQHAGGTGGWGGRLLSSLSGQTTAAKPAQPMTYLEQKRAQAQALYREEQEYWRKNSDEFKRLIEEDMQKQMAEQKASMMSWVTGKPAPSAAPAEGQQPPK